MPAILEYLPYRLSDGTQAGDHQQMGWFAGHGYAAVRVDIRGTGNSGGIIEDEYSEQEQLDGLEVIAWLAEQPWCDGKVGMVGTSWSGFNGLQLAARTPPALGAVVSIYASDDRYADDVHYRGGLVIPMDMAQWANCMLSWNALPPDPAIAGDGWREQWRERLERTPHFLEAWLVASAARRLLAARLGLRELRGHPLPGDGDRRLDRRLHRRRVPAARASGRAAARR